MKVIASVPVISDVVIEIKEVPTAKKSDFYPYKMQKGVKDILISCNPYGKVSRAVYRNGYCGRGMWNNIFSKKTQRELDEIGKIETKKVLNKIECKINLKKYGDWFESLEVK